MAIIEKPCFIHGKHISLKIYLDFAYVVFPYINGDRQEIEVTGTSHYQIFASICFVKLTIPKHQERFSWTQTQTVKPEDFITPAPFYSVKKNPIPMTILDPEFLHTVPRSMTIHHTRTIGLGILEDDGSGGVSSHIVRGFFHASDI